jgi:hypothetical protein
MLRQNPLNADGKRQLSFHHSHVGYRQSDLPSIATSPKQQDSSENTNIHTLTQEVAKLSKTVSELVISKQSG